MQKIATSGQPKLTFEWGLSEIRNFEDEVDVAPSTALWKIRLESEKSGADPGQSGRRFELSQGNLDGDKLLSLIGSDTYTLKHEVPLDPAELQVGQTPAWLETVCR